MTERPAHPRFRVLVVEDDPRCGALLRDALSDRYEVRLEDDGFAALERARQEPPDLLLLDLQLPTLSGFDVLAQWRRDETLSRCPVVVVSARVMRDEPERARALHAVDFVEKPFTLARLRSAAAAALEKRRAGQDQFT
jgi:DNA-binding response OmpR family regulator